MRQMLLAAIVLLGGTVTANASMFDDLDELKGETVVEAGDLKKLSCPISGDYDCLTWPTSLFKLNSYCVEAMGAYSSIYGLRGMLTTDGQVVSLFIIGGGISSPDVKKYVAKMYQCPAGVY